MKKFITVYSRKFFYTYGNINLKILGGGLLFIPVAVQYCSVKEKEGVGAREKSSRIFYENQTAKKDRQILTHSNHERENSQTMKFSNEKQ
jgi:hypothetical protein